MILRDMHVHTVFSDGKDTPEEMVLAALSLGMETLGFSDHSFTRFDTSYCMPEAAIEDYKAEIFRLKEKYAGQIEILCGIEQDAFAEYPAMGYDYSIGSVHYIRLGDKFIPVDETAQLLRDTADWYFGGDIYAVCEEYFRTVAELPESQHPTWIGHFDLISKFNEDGSLFDPQAPRFRAAWKAAAERCAAAGLPFEINTGALARGLRSEPYPSLEMIEYIGSLGGRFVLSSDAHSAETLMYRFADYERYVQE